MFSAQTSSLRRFWETEPDIYIRVPRAPVDPLTNGVFMLLDADNLGFLKAHISNSKKKLRIIWRKKK